MFRSIRLAILGCLITLFSLEIIFQILPVTTTIRYGNTTQSEPILRGTVPFVRDSIDWKFDRAQTRKLNNYGFLNDLDYSLNTQPIAVIGDSHIHSAMLSYSDTLHGQLSKLLHKPNPPVYSFGVSGYSFAGYIGSAEYASKKVSA